MSDPLLDALVAALDARESVALLTITEASGDLAAARGARRLIWQNDARPAVGDLPLPPDVASALQSAAQGALAAGAHASVPIQRAAGALSCFIEVQRPPAHLIICGAGHIAVPLAAMAHLCDFAVSVIDDRAQYANRERFPTADRVLADDFRTALRTLRGDRPHFDPHTCVVLVTRGHQHDVDCLIELIHDPLPYIGMIGSRRRIRAVFALMLEEQQIPPERFTHVYAPVGLDIGAHTPGEIAVAIMGEIINVLRGGPGLSLREQVVGAAAARRAAAGAQRPASAGEPS